jgi:hypothetical protein
MLQLKRTFKTSNVFPSLAMKKYTPILLVPFLAIMSCTRTANKTGRLISYPPITTDIEIGETVRGSGTRAELLGFIRWGDPGRATFQSSQQEKDLGGGVVKQSMQCAVYNALEGQPDHFIVDPHFHTVEHNFLVFKTATTEVVGRRAQNQNYRQIKRFNTDRSDTILLEDAPQTVSIERDGKKPTKLITSSHIKPYVMNSVRVYDTSTDESIRDIQVVDYNGNYNFNSPSTSIENNSLNKGYLQNNKSYQSLSERLNNLNKRLSDYSRQY